jgi:hypothetical protein
MRAVVVYESMYGNTRTVADAIGRGLERAGTVTVVPVGRADEHMLRGLDLLVVGGPTHAHGMSRKATRKAAADGAEKPGSGVVLEPGATGLGVREWLATLGDVRPRAVAFDTRIAAPPLLTGRAAKGIDRELRRRGFDRVVEPESFLVTKENRLVEGEEARAEAWAAELAARYVRGPLQPS